MRLSGLATVLLFVAACSGPTAPPPPAAPPPEPQQPAETNSGAFAVVTVGDQVKAYIPATDASSDGRFQLLVVDAATSQHGASGFLGYVDLGPNGAAEAVAAAPDVVIAVSISYPIIWFIDPATDTVVKELPLPGEYGPWLVSGLYAYMTGAIIDAPRRRAYVSVWSGFLVLDLDTRDIVDHIVVAPSENFGFDPDRNRLVAPFYRCPPPDPALGPPPPCDSYRSPDGTVISEGLNVVDVTTGRIYTYVDAAAPDQAAPAGFEPDSAAVEPSTGRVVLPAEDSSVTLLLDLATAAFDDLTGTFTTPKVTLSTVTPLTGVSVEPASKLAICMEENGETVALFDLPAVTADASPPMSTMPLLPWAAGPWTGHADPHGVRTGTLGGKPVAWLINKERTWMARIDLEGYLALSQQLPLGVPPASMAQVVTYVFTHPAP